MRTALLIVLHISLFSVFPLHSQQLKGKVTDSQGNPIAYATVYIREIALGMIADDKGEFQTTLEKGNYTCEISSLGYERKSLPVQIDNQNISVSIEMENKTYSLKEVKVSARREDPAYAVMRKAISMAPFYLYQIKSYESEVYLKGTVKLEKAPKYLKMVANDVELNTFIGKLFLLESQNEITFTSPDNYEQKVIAYSSSIPADIDAGDAMELITTNIYDPNAFGRISPLSPGAFTYYNFSLEGMSTEGDHLINKIRVTPKKKNPKLVTGWLYIVENSWNVQSADLNATEFGITIRFTATYNEVKPYAFLPTAYDMDMKINLMGVKASGKYYSSIQYKNVEINEQQGVIRKKQSELSPATPASPKTKKQIKNEEQLEKLLSKEDITTKEAYKIANLMEKTVEPEIRKQERETLEIINSSNQVKITVDSMARYRDSIYWEGIRNLPLRQDEIVSYQIKDSLKQVVDSLDRKRGGHSSGWDGLLSGGSQQIKKWRLGYNGLLRAVPEYNFVDGFWIGQQFHLSRNFNKNRSFSLSPAVYYTTARKSVIWEIDADYQYAPLNNGKLSVSGGNTTADFNSEDGTLRLINSLSSLFFAKNPIKFYQKKFIEAENRIDITNGFILTTRFKYEDRYRLENRQSYSFFGGSPDENAPEHQPLMPNHYTHRINLQLEFTPEYHYHLHGKRKHYVFSRYPTFLLRYEKGFSSAESHSGWSDRLEASIHQKIKINSFNEFSYYVNGGKFFSSENVFLPDYKHFANNDLIISRYNPENSFNFLTDYSFSTNRQWIQGHLNYTSKYLFIKNIRFLQSYIFDEALHAKTIWIPGKNYCELGYSLGFTDIARIGIFVGLEKGKYDAVGVTIGLPILKNFGFK